LYNNVFSATLLLGCQTNVEVSEGCGTHWSEGKCMWCDGGETWRKETALKA